MTDFNKKNFYNDFIEEERLFYLKEAGFTEREKALFKLRVYEEKTLWEAGEIMDYSRRTMDRKEDYQGRPDVLSGHFC